MFTWSNSRRRLALMGGAALALTVALTSTTGSGTESAEAAAMPRVGIACTDGPNFDLETDADYISLPDGNSVYMYGYKPLGGRFQHPSPVLCVDEGQTVTVTLHNTLPRDVSIVFPGQNDVLADGEASTPQYGTVGDPATLTSLAQVASANGGTMTYSFVADHPGTFLYESGTDPDVQVHMGLFGMLIVRPTMGDDYAYNDPTTKFTRVGQPESAGALNDEEFMVLLSEVDPYLNQAIENQDVNGATSSFNFDNYHPRYWLINGRGFPDSIADNGASWLPNQPYGALAKVRESDDPSAGIDQRHPHGGLARYLNVGTENYPFHPHGNNGRVVGRDGNQLVDGTADLSFEKFAIDIGPGQTYDVVFKWYDAEHYSDANPVPVVVPQVQNQVFGMFYSGSPYLGVNGAMPPGGEGLNQCGEYYIISHNHALYQLDSWGVLMTGPATYMRIDPDPDQTTCP